MGEALPGEHHVELTPPAAWEWDGAATLLEVSSRDSRAGEWDGIPLVPSTSSLSPEVDGRSLASSQDFGDRVLHPFHWVPPSITGTSLKSCQSQGAGCLSPSPTWLPSVLKEQGRNSPEENSRFFTK